MSDCPVVVLFRGMPPSATLHASIVRHARQLQELAVVDRVHATIERKVWPSRPPTVQVTLKLDLREGELTARAGDFGCSNAYLAMEAAFSQIDCRPPLCR